MASDAVINTLIAEAGGEGEAGMIAAAWAMKQRAAARGQTLDQVIKSGFDGHTNPGSGAVKAQQSQTLRAQANRILQGVEAGTIPNPVPGADHFLSGDAMPSWARSMEHVATIGGHRFYASGQVPDSAQGNSVATRLDVTPPKTAPTPATPSAMTVAKRNLQPVSTDPASLYAGIFPQVAQRGPITTSDLISGRGISETIERTQAMQEPALAAALQQRVAAAQRPQLSSGAISYAGQDGGAQSRAAVVAARSPTLMPVGVSQSYAGQDGARPVTAAEIARAPGVTVASVPSVASRPASPARPVETLSFLSDVPGPNEPPKAQDRLMPSGGLDFNPAQQAIAAATSPLATTVEVENPAYARLMERVRQGEIELRGMTPSGMPLSRDGRARYEASVKALEERLAAQRAELARTQRTISVQQQGRAAQPMPVPAPKASSIRNTSAVQAYRDQGYSPSEAYDAANRASVERAIANSSNPDQARRLNERLGNI